MAEIDISIMIARLEERIVSLKDDIREMNAKLDSVCAAKADTDSKVSDLDKKLTSMEQYGHNNRSLIMWVAGITTSVVLALIAIFINHLLGM